MGGLHQEPDDQKLLISFLLLTVTLPGAKGILSKRRSPYTLIDFPSLDRNSSSPIGLAKLVDFERNEVCSSAEDK